MKRRTDEMERCRMHLLNPGGRRRSYVATWTDPDTGTRRQLSLRTTYERTAFQEAAALARRVVRGKWARGVPWAGFAELYLEHVEAAADHPRGGESWRTVCGHVEAFGAPAKLEQVNGAWVARWEHWLRHRPLSEASVATYLAHLRAALRWAARQQPPLLARPPAIRVSAWKEPRARAVQGEEFERLLMAAERVRPHDHQFASLWISALYYTGLRLGSLYALSWDESADVWLDTSRDYPLIRMRPRGSKSRQQRVTPPLPEFWPLVEAFDRSGFVLPWPVRRHRIARRTVQKVVTQIGKRAGVITNPQTGHTATAHDLRRSYATALARRYGYGAAQLGAGHADIETTMHYVDAEQLAAQMREGSR